METNSILACLFGFVCGQLLVCVGLAVSGWRGKRRKNVGGGFDDVERRLSLALDALLDAIDAYRESKGRNTP